MKAPSLTLGIEEEYQIIDPETRELKSYITEILSGEHVLLGEIKPELHQSMVEVGTKVCRTPAEARSGDRPPAAAGDGSGGPQGAGDRRRRHAPVLVVDVAARSRRSSATSASARTCATWPSSC